MDNFNLFPKRSLWRRRNNVITKDGPSRTPVVIVLAGVAGFVLLGGGVLAGRAGTPVPSPTPTSLPTTAEPLVVIATPTSSPPTPASTPTPSCDDAAEDMRIIKGQIERGNYAIAVATAEEALGRHREVEVCPLAAQSITRLLVAAGMQVIYAEHVDPLDQEGQQRLARRYLDYRVRARAVRAEMDSDVMIANEAHARSKEWLCKAALEQAYREGMFNPEVQRETTTHLFASCLFGIGMAYTKAEKGNVLYNEGLAWLVASDTIADRFQTYQSEAEARLVQLLGDDKESWPAPAATPLLTL